MKVTTRAQLKDYCFRSLGFPYVDVNVTDEQVDDKIDDAIQKYNDFAENGTQRTFYRHVITADDLVTKSIPMPTEVTGVIRVLPFGSGGYSSGSPFNVTYQLRLNDMFDLGSGSLTYYVQAQQYLSMLDMILNGQPSFRYNRVQDKLFLDVQWGTKLMVGMYVVVECYTAINPVEYNKMWNESWFKKYATTKIKSQWGMNLKKFSGIQLIGGVGLNGQQMYDEAEEELKELDQQLRDIWSEPPQFFMG